MTDNLLNGMLSNRNKEPDMLGHFCFIGELIGLEYLYSQSSQGGIEQKVQYAETTAALEDDSRDNNPTEEDYDEDEGFGELENVDPTIPAIDTVPVTSDKPTGLLTSLCL